MSDRIDKALAALPTPRLADERLARLEIDVLRRLRAERRVVPVLRYGWMVQSAAVTAVLVVSLWYSHGQTVTLLRELGPELALSFALQKQ